jgi:hypothetical protein
MSPIVFTLRYWSRLTALALAAFAGLPGLARAATTDFVTAVTSTHPIAYYRLDATSGKSEVGASTYKSIGGTVGSPGAPVGDPSSQYAQLNGKDAFILATQSGGVNTAGSIMAWVNLASLPSKEGHIFYVAGESQNGNDFDLQIETDNALRFFTAGGGNVSFAPPVATLVNQWHLVVATVDTVSKVRVLYWDGKAVATDGGGGRAGKTAAFSIGASTVFGGRFFKGGIEEAALWNRALKGSEVMAIYAASSGTASGATGAGAMASSGAAAGTGPFATKAKVDAEDANGPIKLKREEQIAIMFMGAMEEIEHDCQLSLQHVCTYDQLLKGVTVNGHVDRLKFDPKVDPNYSYTLAAAGMAWEAHANPKKPGLTGFCWMSRSIGTTVTTYNPTGAAGWTDKEIMGRGIDGDSFAIQ